MIQVTIAVPVALIAAANQLARVIGYSEADGETFSLAPVIDGHAVASGLVEAAFITDAFLPLEEPEYGADMALARTAQAAVVVVDPESPSDPPEGSIRVVVGLDPDAAKTLLGLNG